MPTEIHARDLGRIDYCANLPRCRYSIPTACLDLPARKTAYLIECSSYGVNEIGRWSFYRPCISLLSHTGHASKLRMSWSVFDRQYTVARMEPSSSVRISNMTLSRVNVRPRNPKVSETTSHSFRRFLPRSWVTLRGSWELRD